MKTKSNLYFLIAAALLAWPASGCGDSTECGPGTVKLAGQCVAEQPVEETPDNNDSNNETPIECGQGTVEADGECVPDGEDTQCGPKTALQDGQCVIAADACESGETLDPNSGECVTGGNGGSECGAGTALDTESGECVATEDVCDTGTVFDQTSGLCLPDACQAGDVLLGGVCVSPAQELAAQADVEETENNDPAQGGSSNELTLKPVGESTVFTGTIAAPTDLTGDGEVNQDLDIFHFEAEAGQWLQISVQSTGIPSPAFLIEGPNGYQRLSPQLGGSDTARQLLIPADGTYTVTVAPAAYTAAVMAGRLAGGPYGAGMWGYVGSIEQTDAPTPTDVDPAGGSLVGDYATLTDNQFNFTGLSAGEGVTLDIATSQADATGILQTWSDGEYVGSTPIAAGDTLNLISSDSGDLQVLIDWQTLGGLASDFEIHASTQAGTEGLGPIDAGDSVDTDPINLAYGESTTYTFSADPGQVISLSFDSDSLYGPTQVKLTNSSGAVLLPKPGQSFEYETVAVDRYAYSYTQTGGTFQLELTPGNGFDLDNLVAHISTTTPTDLGDLAAGDSVEHNSSAALDAWASDFYMMSSAETLVASGQIEGDSGVYLGAKFVSESNQVLSDLGSQNTTLQLQETVVAPGTTLLQVSAQNTALTAYTVDLDIADATQLEVEPNGGPNLASAFDITSALYGSVAGSNDDDYYSFSVSQDMAAGEVLLLELAELDSANATYQCTLRDENGDLIGVNNANALNQGCITMAKDLQASDTYYLHIKSQRQHPTNPLNYKLSASIETGSLEVEANEDAASATPIDIDALQSGESVFGALPTSSDTDYLSFTLAADMAPGDEIALVLAQLAPFTTQYGNWRVLDASEAELTSSGLNGALSLMNLSAGTYYIELSRNSYNPADGLVYRIDAL